MGSHLTLHCIQPEADTWSGEPCGLFSQSPQDPADDSFLSAHHVHSPDFKAGFMPEVLCVWVVFRVFFLISLPFHS